MSMTLKEAISKHGVEVHDYLDREALVPVHTGMQRQGDVLVVPAKGKASGEAVQVPAQGIPVVRGEAGGNTHLLLAEGDVKWTVDNSTTLSLGTLTVAQGATAWLAHPEHAYSGIGPGTYSIKRQREQADEIRLVQD